MTDLLPEEPSPRQLASQLNADALDMPMDGGRAYIAMSTVRMLGELCHILLAISASLAEIAESHRIAVIQTEQDTTNAPR